MLTVHVCVPCDYQHILITKCMSCWKGWSFWGLVCQASQEFRVLGLRASEVEGLGFRGFRVQGFRVVFSMHQRSRQGLQSVFQSLSPKPCTLNP